MIDSNTVTNTYRGVRVVNCMGGAPSIGEILSNNFHPDLQNIPTASSASIAFFNSNNAVAGQNLVTNDLGTIVNSRRPVGVWMDQSSNLEINNNTFYNIGTGIYANNSFAQQHLICNEMDNNYRGVVLNASYIGDQGDDSHPQDNMWYGNDPIRLAVEGISATPSFWYTRNNNNYPYYPIDQFPLFLPYIPAQTLLASSIPSENCVNPCTGPACRITYLVNVAQQEGFFTDLSYQAQAAAIIQAYEMLMADSSLMFQGTTNDEILQDFAFWFKNSNSGRLYDINEYIQRHDTNNAIILNHTINNPTLAEENCRTVNEIYLNTWARDNYEFTDEQRTALEGIASQNPMDGGSCVFSVWVMLDLDMEYLIPEQGRIAIQNEQNQNFKASFVKLFPNPATNNISVTASIDGIIEINDIAGKTMLTANCLTGRNEINTATLKTGMYLYTYKAEGQKDQKGKLIIMK